MQAVLNAGVGPSKRNCKFFFKIFNYPMKVKDSCLASPM